MATAPRGRPPIGCVWGGSGWIDADTGEPHNAKRLRERALRARREYERRRYWDTGTEVRKRRLERSAKQSGRPLRPVQLKLDSLCDLSSGGQNGQRQTCVQASEKAVGSTINLTNNDPWMETSRSHRFVAARFARTSFPTPDCASAAVVGQTKEA